MRVDLGPFLDEHPDGAAHRDHGATAVTATGHPSSGRRWDYTAPRMRGWCGCGWAGPTHPQRRPKATRGAAVRSEWDRLNRAARDAIEHDWSDHVHQALPTLRVLEVMAELRDAERALTAAVIEARTGRASWSEVAAAVGVAKQSAHRRWGALDPLTPDERSKGGRPRTRPGDPDTVDPEGGDQVPAAGRAAPGPQSATDRAQVTARQVRRLADELSRRTDRHVAATWQGTRGSDGRRGGWLLEWSAGPTRAEMRELAATAAAADPELATFDLAGLAWWRSSSDVDDAAATLAWLTEHPDHPGGLRYLSTDALPGWPERLPARTRARAETLVAAGWASQTASDAADTLAATAARGGPDAVAAWLDDLAETGNGPGVDLSTQP